jgi:murein DD-endopeptidase MepM/ murein hydrolase activator NlpD
MKKFWPVPKSYSRNVREVPDNAYFKGKDFYIDEKHRKVLIWHSGIDLYCPVGSNVLAIEDCTVVKIWEFTAPSYTPGYRKTWAVNVRNNDGKITVYGEVRKPQLRTGQRVRAGQVIGHVAQLIYTRNRPQEKLRCMLHFELYRKGTRTTLGWWLRGAKRPKNLLNPTMYLEECT